MTRFVAFLLACVHSVSSVAGLPGMVLCLGADGHIEFEIACGVGCEGDDSRDRHDAEPRQQASSGTGSCGECVDIPLSTQATSASRRQTGGAAAQIQANLAASHLYPTSTLRSEDSPRLAKRDTTPRATSSLASLRCVVLLI